MKIALITDTHFGARGDSMLFYDYMMEFYNEVFFPYIDEKKINTVIHLGDVVDRRKFINFNVLHRFKKDFLGGLQKRKLDTHIIIGNHDTYFKNTNTINAMNELIDFNHPYAPKVYTDPIHLTFDDRKICIMPWINSENYENALSFIKKSDAEVLFGHLEIAGFEMNRGMRCEDGLSIKKFDKFNLVCSGHFHHKSNNGKIHYLGNPYETTWMDYNDPKGFHIFDTETLELEFIKNPFKMFHKVYYDEDKKQDISNLSDRYVKIIVQNKTDSYKFDVFLDSLYKQNVADISVVEDNQDFVEEGDVDVIQDTMTLLSEYIDGYEMTIDKTRLKGFIKELYVDAIRENA